MPERISILIILIPFIGALLFPLLKHNIAKYLSLIVSMLILFLAIFIFSNILNNNPFEYNLGGWKRDVGVAFWFNKFNLIFCIVLSSIYLLTQIFFIPHYHIIYGKKLTKFLSLQALFFMSCFGLILTADIFNLYVFLEISALSSYALIALGKGRAYVASLRYLILGSVGASLYLLGVGFLFAKFGTLNIFELQSIVQNQVLGRSTFVSLVLIILGLLLKMGQFPFYIWLPEAYEHSPTSVSTFMAPISTKVSAFLLFKVLLGVFSISQIKNLLPESTFFVHLATVSIFYFGAISIRQNCLKKMLLCVLLAEISYLTGSFWILSKSSLSAFSFHIISDSLMIFAGFVCIAAIEYLNKSSQFKDLKGIGRKMPFTTMCFILALLSLIGLPPMCGFFSKFYIILGAFKEQHFLFGASLLFSSLMLVIATYKLIPILFFEDYKKIASSRDVPLRMKFVLACSILSLFFVGIFSGSLMKLIS